MPSEAKENDKEKKKDLHQWIKGILMCLETHLGLEPKLSVIHHYNHIQTALNDQR